MRDDRSDDGRIAEDDAHRARVARVARLALVALAVSLGSETLFDLLAGHAVVFGTGAHLTVLAAVFIGVGAGVLLGGTERAGSRSADAGALPKAQVESEDASRSTAASRDALLVLRPVTGALWPCAWQRSRPPIIVRP